ncbi:ABC transporter permease [Pseudoxanthomonas sp. UTMC 1351]|uniref:ABC transporter permease n=1 Tax=Pseudoxanthomonas sp. UTMC 1351 TaxID=2695853 RepID=UPI0034CDFAD4
MSIWPTELALIMRSRIAVAALALLFTVCTAAVVAGLHAASLQQATIARALQTQTKEMAVQAGQHAGEGKDAGDTGYYTFHATWDPPAPLAFAALGQRDVQPYLLRVRLLGLQAQLYESENFNAELVLPGTFDFAFVLVYLMPLVVIALMHDLVTGERESGRLRLLMATASHNAGGVWRRRILLRGVLVLAALMLPLLAGTAYAGAWGWQMLAVLVVAGLYVAFWFAVSAWAAARQRGSATSAMLLIGVWIAITLLLPTLANTVINRAVPAGRGVDLMLAQRQSVHAGWDQPKEATFERFFRTHPEWRGTPPVVGRFHWKWYYAMHQAGDDAVAGQVGEYRDSLLTRQVWTDRAGWLLPGVATQSLLHRLADTDLHAQLAYQDQIVAFHKRLRLYFYPYLFQERRFTRADFDNMPAYEVRSFGGSLPWAPLLALVVLTGLLMVLAAGRFRRISAAM